MLCREWRQILLTLLLVICHDFTGGIFDWLISRQIGMKSPLKWHNQGGKKGLLESLLRWEIERSNPGNLIVFNRNLGVVWCRVRFLNQ